MSIANDSTIADIGTASFTAKVMLVYGPYAFSMVSLLMIWFSIVNPTLDRQKLDFTRNELILDKIREVQISQLEASRSIERAALLLESIIKRAEKP